MTGLWETQETVWETCTGVHHGDRGQSCKAGVDMQVDPMATALTSDTQSITSTFSWLLWELQPAPFHAHPEFGGHRKVGQLHSISHALIHADAQHNSRRAQHMLRDHLLTLTQPVSRCATLAWQLSPQ